MEKIRIKYFSEDIEKLTYIDGKSDWIDLRAAKAVSYTHLDVYKRQGKSFLVIAAEHDIIGHIDAVSDKVLQGDNNHHAKQRFVEALIFCEKSRLC